MSDIQFIKLGFGLTTPDKWFRECCENGVFGKKHECPKFGLGASQTPNVYSVTSNPTLTPVIEPQQAVVRPGLDPSIPKDLKRGIKELCDEIDPTISFAVDAKKAYQKIVLEKTGMDLSVPENYLVIIKMLRSAIARAKEEEEKLTATKI